MFEHFWIVIPGDLSVELHSLVVNLGDTGSISLHSVKHALQTSLSFRRSVQVILSFGSDVRQPSTDSLALDLLYDHHWSIGTSCCLKVLTTD